MAFMPLEMNVESQTTATVEMRKISSIIKLPSIAPISSYGASLAVLDHTVWPATRHRWTCTVGGMEGSVDLGKSYIPVRRQSPILVVTTWQWP